MRRWPSGVAVVTAGTPGRPSGCTVNAFLSVSLSPPLLLVSLAGQSRTLSAIVEHGVFGINILSWRQRQLANRFAQPGPGRFAGVAQRADLAVPLLRDVLDVAIYDLNRLVPAADHVLVLGGVIWCESGDAARPLVFEREHRTLSPSPAS